MKKLLSVVILVAMCLSFSVPAMAVSVGAPEEVNTPLVYSPEFPDAYILQSVSTEKARSSSTTQTVIATVFVEEEYSFDSDGNLITTSSRLLPEHEVLAIGLNNFEDMEVARQEAVSKAMQTRAAMQSRGKLTISFSGAYYILGNSIQCDLTGNASWSAGTNPFDYAGTPASGSDYMGVVWSGGFSCISSSLETTSSISDYDPPVCTKCDATPNAGEVWEFTETWNKSLLGQMVSIYLSSIDVNLTIEKKNMTGNGNTAEAVLKYIHTYESQKGSISIEASESGVGGSFSLSSVDKQWSIVCTVTKIPY